MQNKKVALARLTSLVTLCAFSGLVAAQTTRVNVGGPAYTDVASNLWSADSGFNTGNQLSWPANTSIAGTSDPTLYQTERWDSPSAPEMAYTFNVPNGTYTVRLHFAENYDVLFAVGQRVFDVNIQGALVFDDLDVFAQAGARTALIKTATATVTNGTLTITFVHQVEDPFVNAIEIINQSATDTTPPSAPSSLTATAASQTQIDLAWGAATDNVGVTEYLIERCQGAGCSNFAQFATATGTTYSNTGLTAGTSYNYRVRARDAADNRGGYSNSASATTPSAPPPPTTAMRVNVGGPTYTDAASNVWGADSGFNTGNQLSWPANTSIAGTSDPTLYQTERWDSSSAPEMTYSANVPNGTYTVRLHFAENYDVLFAVGQRVFDVNIQGALVFDDLDVFAQAGARTALIKTATAAVTNGTLTITFVHQVEDPFVNAIEIISQTGAPDTTPPSTPSGLTVTAAVYQNVLSWTASTDNIGVTGYLIERCQGTSCSSFAQIDTSVSAGYTDTTAVAGISYSYRVRARDAVPNFSGYSTIGTAIPADCD